MQYLPFHRTIVVVDVARFTDPARTMTHQWAVREGLHKVLDTAFAESGIDLDICMIENRGDGAMILLPPEVSKSLLADQLPVRLVAGLRRYNAIHSSEAVVQLRVGLHSGEIRANHAGGGVVGPAISFAFRILEAPEAKQALRKSSRVLALIASETFYQDVIVHDPAAAAESYRRIPIRVKETSAQAWLRLLPDGDAVEGPEHIGSVISRRWAGQSQVVHFMPLVDALEPLALPGEAVMGDAPVDAYADDVPAIFAPRASLEDRVPVVWGNVPARNPNFTGRDQLLDQLSKKLADGGTTAILPAALHGMGGIGKTQIAVEYIYRHLRDYAVVWWIQAAQPAQVRAALTELAQHLRLPGVSEAAAAVPAVLEALRLGRPHRRWLLVFDAAESPDSIRHFFPTNGSGRVLITSRSPEWASVARPLEVTVFHRDESVELLRRRGPELADGDADQLAQKLGDLPLAVDQAAAWRAETGMPVREYLRLFQEKVVEILDTSAPTGYEVSVAAAWNVSFDELATRSPAAHQLLQVCAFFAPEPITRTLFTGARGVSISRELDAALRDPMQLSRSIRDIARYGLAKIDHRNNTLHLHRLVQLVVRNRMSPEQRVRNRHAAHLLLANHDPNNPKSAVQWPRYQELLPHIAACELTECKNSWVRQLVINLMQYLFFWGDFDAAASLARQAIADWTELSGLGAEDPQVLEAASYLGLYLWVRGRFAEAAEMNERTLELRRRISGDDSEATIIAQLRVAVDTQTRGDFSAARALQEQIYERVLRLYGEDDPITLQTAHDLAVTVRLCGDYRRAFELNRRTSQRRAEVLGYDNVDTLNTLSGMFMDRRELGEYALARAEHERMAQRVRELLGEDKNDTLRRFAYLAVARRRAGDHDGALELSGRTYALFRRQYGEDHPVTMTCAIDHANDLRYADDLEGALVLGRTTFERYRGMMGESHPHTLAAAVDLAVTLRLRGDPAAAQELNSRSLECFRQALGSDHPYSIVCAIDLASDHAALGDAEAAHAIGSDAHERGDRVLGADHPTTIAAALNIALDLRALGRTQQADTQHAEVVARFRRVLGETHPITIAAAHGHRANCDIDPLPL